MLEPEPQSSSILLYRYICCGILKMKVSIVFSDLKNGGTYLYLNVIDVVADGATVGATGRVQF